MKVATTASPKNHERLKTLGADIVFDYRVRIPFFATILSHSILFKQDPDVVEKLKAATSDSISLAMDCISEVQHTASGS